MPMPFQPWRAALLPASYAGCGFKVEAGGFSGGRRLAVHEYAHLDTPFVEDLGRKARRWQVTGYCVGPDYLDSRDALVEACETEGPATLMHPSFGSQQVHCEVCNPVEVREKGGYVVFELVFVEAGQSPDASATSDTASQAAGAAGASNDASASTVDDGLAGKTGGGVGGINAGAGSGDPPDGANGVMGGYPNGIDPGLRTGPTGFVVGGA